jgi:hypothetical protein
LCQTAQSRDKERGKKQAGKSQVRKNQAGKKPAGKRQARNAKPAVHNLKFEI